MDIQTLYEDEHILAVNKPAGLIVHGDGKREGEALTDWIVQNYPDTENVGEPIQTTDGKTISRPGIVHRLDRETSGVMLVAKTAEGHACLKKQFQDHTIEKEYNAFVYGVIKGDKGIIDRPIGRSSSDFRLWSAQRGARGEMREAVTEYTVISRGQDYTYVSVRPKTGRTHQIRVHFKAIHYPLVCDSLYAPGRDNTLGFTRLALHSHRVSFATVSGVRETVTAPYPPDFERAIHLLQN